MNRLFLFLLGVSSFLSAATFTTFPKNLQFFARDSVDSGAVTIAGSQTTPQAESLIVILYKNGVLHSRTTQKLLYVNGIAPFSLTVKLHAELSEYALRVYTDADSIGAADSLACGDAYIISGQSNSITVRAYSALADSQNEWIRSYDDFREGTFKGWGLATGHNMSSGAKQGPSIGAWGWYLANGLVNRHQIPIAIINAGVGGTLIQQHLKNEQNPYDQYSLYTNHLTRSAASGLKPFIKAFLWHQGESDGIAPNYTLYATRFDSLYQCLKRDYPRMRKVYLFQIHTGCGANRGGELREVQRKIPERYTDVQVMSTSGLQGHSYQNDFCHYEVTGYSQMASRIRPLIERDFYGSIDTMFINPPNIQSAYYTTPFRTQIALQLTQPVQWDLSLSTRYWLHRIEHAFLIDSLPGQVRSLVWDTTSSRLLVNLNRPFTASRISYIPSLHYPDTTITYEGPWLMNPRGVGALSFFHFPITVPDSVQDTSLALLDTLTPDSISLAEKNILLIPGDSLRPRVIGHFHRGQTHYSRDITLGLTWLLESSTIATVQGSGALIALNEGGPTKAVVEKNGKKDSLMLTVKATPEILYRINFQDQGQPTIPDWTVENWGRFSSTRGFGWDSMPGTGHAYHGATLGPWVLRTYVAIGVGNYNNEKNCWARYRIKVPQGNYLLRLGMGNQLWVGSGGRTNDIAVYQNDTLMNKGYGYCQVGTYRVTVTGDSGLQLKVFGAINYLVVLPESFYRYVDYFARDSIATGNPIIPPVTTIAEKSFLSHTLHLSSNHPNPFNPTTTIRFSTQKGVQATYTIYNTKGQKVFCTSVKTAGDHAIVWSGRDTQGKAVASGLYLGRLKSSNGMAFEQRLILIK